MPKEYEVVVVGAGPAAFSAATFLARAGVRVLAIGDPAQSGLADASEVWNYPGFPSGIKGAALLQAMQEQATRQGAVFISGEVTHVEKINTQHSHFLKKARMSGGEGFSVKTSEAKEFFAQNLLLAHGANFIKVDLPGEKERVGKGVHYCALCDGPLYAGKEVVVLGNGNYAAEEALQLAGMGVRVTKIISQARATTIAPAYQQLLKEKNIPVVIDRLEKIDQATGTIFIALGVASSSAFAQKLGLETKGNFLKADENGRTNVPGVWVAGLARGGVNQIAKSVGDGVVAAADIIKEVKGLLQYLDHV